MSKAEREGRHQSNLERICRVQVVTGRGDGLRIDHEATVFERARMTGEELRSHEATERGLAALDRLLRVADERSSRSTHDVVTFVRAVCNGRPLALHTLRALDHEVADDMLAVLDAFRHARLELVESVEGGPARVRRILDKYSARV